MKKLEIDPIMSQLDEFQIVSAHQLITSIIDEDFELACKIRDDIDFKIAQIFNLLVNKNLTTLEPEILFDLLYEKQTKYIKEFEEIFNLDKERRLEV